jgi:hypothetical protein
MSTVSGQKTNDVKSKLALAIESRPRVAHEFEVQGFFGLGDKEIVKVAIWVNVKSEQDSALAAAYKIVESLTGDNKRASEDDDILVDAKTTQILFQACRRAEEGDEEAGYKYPAFPSPEWMRQNLTTDQLAVLLNLYHEVRRRESPTPWDITHESVMTLVSVCSKYDQGELSDTILSAQSREWLQQAFIILSQAYSEKEDELKFQSKSIGHGSDAHDVQAGQAGPSNEVDG